MVVLIISTEPKCSEIVIYALQDTFAYTNLFSRIASFMNVQKCTSVKVRSLIYPFSNSNTYMPPFRYS